MINMLRGAGLGLRREFFEEFMAAPPSQVAFLEVAPENWMHVGGKRLRDLEFFTEKYPLVCHGLSLSIGSPAPLDQNFISDLKIFLDNHNVIYYSDHLSYCSDEGHLYDLMPIPFTQDAVYYVAKRIQRVQDILQRRIAIENVSYYAAPGQELTELEFTNAILDEADCDLLLDVNNIYVNSLNHGYNPSVFLKNLKPKSISYIHIAGHDSDREIPIDTHGENVIEPVWDLLAQAYEQFGILPTLVERDFNFPPFNELLSEVDRVITTQNQWLSAE